MAIVLLSILKIIGLIVLVLLGLLLTAVLLILFVPVRYRIRVHRRAEDETPVVANIRVSYLAHILNIAFSYPEAAYLRVRIFCFTVFRSDKQREKKKASSKNKKRTAGNKAASEKADAERKELSKREAGKEETKTETEKKGTKENKTEEIAAEESEIVKEKNVKEGSSEDTEKKAEEKEISSAKEKGQAENKIFGFFKKIWSVLKNIRYTITKICDKIKDIVNNIRYYVEILQSERFSRAWGVCKGQVGSLLKMLKPKKMTGELLVGTGDPASTGQVMAIYGILYPLIGSHLDVVPDFERQIVEGSLFIKGKITIFGFLKSAWIVYFNKDIRELIKLLKREAV